MDPRAEGHYIAKSGLISFAYATTSTTFYLISSASLIKALYKAPFPSSRMSSRC
jgi:hypothetical protein